MNGEPIDCGWNMWHEDHVYKVGPSRGEVLEWRMAMKNRKRRTVTCTWTCLGANISEIKVAGRLGTERLLPSILRRDCVLLPSPQIRNVTLYYLISPDCAQNCLQQGRPRGDGLFRWSHSCRVTPPRGFSNPV